MRNKSQTEIDLPWQIETSLFGVAIIAAGLIVTLAALFLRTLLDQALDELLVVITDRALTESVVNDAIWPISLAVFGILSFRIYAVLRTAVAHRLAVF